MQPLAFSLLPLSALAALLALASQAGAQSDELETICRANELAVPDSCPCTVGKAREAGIGEAALRSLVTDDGNTDPVDQQTYTRFWMVKAQCIADVTMAGLGLPSDLPGMPGQPPLLPAPPPGAAPLPPAPPAPAAPPPTVQPGQAAAPAASAAGAPAASGPAMIDVGLGDRLLDFAYEYEAALDAHPALVAEILRRRDAEYAEASAQAADYGEPRYSDRYEFYGGWSIAAEAGPLLSVQFGGNGNWEGAHGSYWSDALLWHTGEERLTSWDEVFAFGLERHARRAYCGGLDRVRAERGMNNPGAGCPAFEELTVTLDTGGPAPQLRLVADPYVAGSYAEGTYEVTVPLTRPEIAEGVRQPYRAALGLAGSGPAAADRSLAARVGVIADDSPYMRDVDCGGAAFRVEGDPGSIVVFDQLKEVMDGADRIFASGGQLGVDGSFHNGLVWDGAFRELDELGPLTGMIEPATGMAFGSGDFIVELAYTNRAYNPAETWGAGLLTIRDGGSSINIPVVYWAVC